MDKIFQGAREFQRDGFDAHRELFGQLGRQQKPHTLFIGCSDSRVVPTMITKTQPGELFLVRNVANIVPPCDSEAHDGGTSATIEYAVNALGVESIVVCGHSNCGGCAAMNLEPAALDALPHTRKWLELSQEVPVRVAEMINAGDESDRERLTEQVNVMVQMGNLLSYPFVQKRVASGDLKILGWHYTIETGEILNYNEAAGRFEKVT